MDFILKRFSLCCNSLIILDLCRNMANIAMRIPNKIKSLLSPKECKNIGNKIAEIKEDKETYPQITKVASHVKAKIKIVFAINTFFMARPISTPKLVAMPFPPLNLRNIVQL